MITSLQKMKNTIEAILFAAGYPVTYAKLAEVLETDVGEIKKVVASLSDDYDDRGIQLVIFEDSCQFCSAKEYEMPVRNALGIKGNTNLSNSSLEVLSVIAYNQPVTRAYIEQVRGVDCTYAINNLTAKGLIEVKGRLDAPGKPMLYVTTSDFLRCFGLKSLADLPERSNVIDNAVNQDEAASDSGEKIESPV